jgi:hypothetical protein
MTLPINQKDQVIPGEDPVAFSALYLKRYSRPIVIAMGVGGVLAFLTCFIVDLLMNHQIITAIRTDALGQSTVDNFTVWVGSFIGVMACLFIAWVWTYSKWGAGAIYTFFLVFLALGVRSIWGTSVIEFFASNWMMGGLGQAGSSGASAPLWVQGVIYLMIACIYTAPGMLLIPIKSFLMKVWAILMNRSEALSVQSVAHDAEDQISEGQVMDERGSEVIKNKDALGKQLGSDALDTLIAGFQTIKAENQIKPETPIAQRIKFRAVQQMVDDAIAKVALIHR